MIVDKAWVRWSVGLRFVETNYKFRGKCMRETEEINFRSVEVSMLKSTLGDVFKSGLNRTLTDHICDQFWFHDRGCAKKRTGGGWLHCQVSGLVVLSKTGKRQWVQLQNLGGPAWTENGWDCAPLGQTPMVYSLTKLGLQDTVTGGYSIARIFVRSTDKQVAVDGRWNNAVGIRINDPWVILRFREKTASSWRAVVSKCQMLG